MKIKMPVLIPPMKASSFVLITSILTSILFNWVLFSFVLKNTNIYSFSGFEILSSVFIIAFLFTFIFASLISLISPVILKIILSITAALNAIALYFMTTYQVVLDRTMMGNIFNTKYTESSELITYRLTLFLICFGFIPTYFFIKTNVIKNDRKKVITNAIIGFLISLTLLYINASSWLWIDKYASLLGGKILPWSYIVNTGRHHASLNKTTENQIPLPDGKFSDNEKMVFVLVIGETARSDNFSLYGYQQNTNPKLQQTANLLVLKNTKSCTTYTTGSIACMLSPDAKSKNTEALPTYLTRHGADVIWRTNNWGEPPIDVSSYVTAGDLRPNCIGDGCNLDEVLLTNLTKAIKESKKQKIFVILHTKGSHGPSYYTRYTQAFNQFVPTCRDEEISKCYQSELINAYDNTILYTDHFLATLIQKLDNLSNIPSAMMYISDHGESLGEHGLYLHGTPYSFAPNYQKNIPFLLWMSDSLQNQKQISLSSIKQTNSHSHFNVFHTILGAFNFHSPIYQRELDILKTN